ncbi:hypothetical protein JUNP353_3822 [Elizabethkingia anophelis]|nr:hypothetical protein JUNP353_3822 [Elizabethkingia anophelis]
MQISIRAYINADIHIGAVTHHQDQFIVLVNFKIRKTMKTTVDKPNPELLELLLLLMLFYFTDHILV